MQGRRDAGEGGGERKKMVGIVVKVNWVNSEDRTQFRIFLIV